MRWTWMTVVCVALAMMALTVSTARAGGQDDCAKKLGGKWEIVAEDEQTAKMIEVFGKQTMIFDMKKKSVSAVIGKDEKPAKPFTIDSCKDDEIVFSSEKEKGGKLSLRVTFTAADKISIVPASAGSAKTPAQVFKKID
ncbi:MAG: hypothetical protein KJ042_01210 [Deltaproteobacteria bacterium]|nr:hypothetical protein [Deltaproteobacteria bacterium]